METQRPGDFGRARTTKTFRPEGNVLPGDRFRLDDGTVTVLAVTDAHPDHVLGRVVTRVRDRHDRVFDIALGGPVTVADCEPA